MVTIPEQQRHLKDYMKGNTSTIASLYEESSEEGMYINKVGAYNPMSYVKNPPFYVSIKTIDKITHCFLIDGGSSPNVMPKIVMEELGLSCTHKNSKSMLSYNSQQQVTIGEIKYVTLVFCVHPEIRTTYNIQVVDMQINNYYIILGRDWKTLTSGYICLDGSHMSLSNNGKNIIFLKEGQILPYIESLPKPHVNYIEEYLGVYSFFLEEDDDYIYPPQSLKLECGTCTLMVMATV